MSSLSNMSSSRGICREVVGEEAERVEVASKKTGVKAKFKRFMARKSECPVIATPQQHASPPRLYDLGHEQLAPIMCFLSYDDISSIARLSHHFKGAVFYYGQEVVRRKGTGEPSVLNNTRPGT